MNVQEAIKRLGTPPVGFSSLMAAMHGGDLKSVMAPPAVGVPTLEAAKAALAGAQKAQDECKSDAAYWGYMGQISYWEALVQVLEAAERLGADNLPDIELGRGGVVMDQCAALSRFGAAMAAAKPAG